MSTQDAFQTPIPGPSIWRDLRQALDPAARSRLALSGGDRAAPLDLHVLYPQAFDGVGPSQTCLSISEAAGAAGARVRVYGTRRRVEAPRHVRLETPFANIGALLPHRKVGARLAAAIEARILATVPEGAVVHAWPSISLQTFLELKRRGCFISLEMINILTLAEKKIIEDEQEREGFRYEHYVTPNKIFKQVQMLAEADLVFAANQHSEASLIEYGVDPARVVPTCYASSERHARVSYATDCPVFTFAGRINMEKGVHHLLRAWRAAGVRGELHLYGRVDEAFARRYGDLLAQPSVRLMGFCRDMSRAYRMADAFIFLSLAEGGPLVTIEAAAHGLPMIVSPMGGGRIAEHDRTALVVEPSDTEATADAIRALASSADLRRRLGEAAFARSAGFNWTRAAADRLQALRLAAPGRNGAVQPAIPALARGLGFSPA